MVLFLLVFFLIYGGLHLYLFAKIRGAFHPGFGSGLCLIFFLIVMLLAPIAVRVSERYGFESLSRIISYVGYLWMGALFLFITLSLIFDFYHFFIHAGGFIFRRDLSHLVIPPMYALMLPVILSLVLNVYGYFEAKDVRTERITIGSSKIPEKTGRIRIVQITDIHLGLVVREDRMRRIIEEVIKTEPDILVSTGDLVDGQINNLDEAMGLLREIRPKYGKYAVTGNHEFFAGLDQALEFLGNSGFTVLRGEGVTVAGLINIIGVDDPAGIRYGLFKGVSEGELLSRFPRAHFTVLLKHLPIVERDASGMFELQLSGHTHGGQIFPFCFITKLFFPFHEGNFTFRNNSRLYVSRGAGTWGPPIRFLSPPEITVIDIVHEKKCETP